MGQVEKISFEVSAETAEALREVVATGEFGSIEEAVQDALEGWAIERAVVLGISDAELRELLAEAPTSDEPGQDGKAAMAELRAWLEDHIASLDAADRGETGAAVPGPGGTEPAKRRA